MRIVPVCTIPAELSPQALPLGAASIVAAINCSFQSQPAEQEVSARLVSFPPEENLPEAIARQLLELEPAASCCPATVQRRLGYHGRFFPAGPIRTSFPRPISPAC